MKYFIGIDEAGRGPLAGPVAAGAVIVPVDFDWSSVAGATDSKKMTEKNRERIFSIMNTLQTAGKLDFAVAFSSSHMIDTYGIVPAVRSALDRAITSVVKDVALQDIEVLLDGGLHAPEQFEHQQTIIRGDLSEPVISLASIAAKVTRDRLMVHLSEKYPAYGFDIHKGYGTLAHRRMIEQNGLCELHRATFCKNFTKLRAL